MTDWTTARVTPEMQAELRRLLERATPGPWHAWDRGIGYEVHTEVEHNPIRCDPLNSGFRETFGGPDAHLIAAAVNALPALLDAADALRAELAHMTEARNNARAEVERLTAMVEAVREYAAARQANIDHGPLLSARKAAHDALLAALARLDEEPQPWPPSCRSRLAA